VVLTYALLLHTSLAAPAYARAHQYLAPEVVAAYAAPWLVALASALVVAGIMLALVPLRRGERWAWCTEPAIFIILFATRASTDPRCLVVLDPHQHGCHSFMAAALLGLVGLALAWR
jgi:hypothetical protein